MGLKFRGLRKKDLFRDDFVFVITVNAEIFSLASENRRLKKIIIDNWATIDGIIPYIIAKLRCKAKNFEKISGADFIYDICKHAEQRGEKVFLLGAQEKVNRKAIVKLKSKFPNLKISGYSPPFHPYPFPEEEEKKIRRIIKREKPGYLVVAFGPPKQEFWIDDNKEFLKELGVKLAIGVGGTLDMVSGKEMRAPRIVQKMGFEWLWRTFQNPARVKRLGRVFSTLKYMFKY